MAAILKVRRQIENPTPSIDEYLLEEQHSGQISSRSDLWRLSRVARCDQCLIFKKYLKNVDVNRDVASTKFACAGFPKKSGAPLFHGYARASLAVAAAVTRCVV